jgi:imidazoleglycerol phosphate synthase cyclase subunit
MKEVRIIPCLDVKDGRVVKGVKFVNLRDARDPVEAAQAYCREGADELVFLDILATVENRKTRLEWVKKVCDVVTIPFAVGGGISSIEDMAALIDLGVDKVSINTAAVKKPELVKEAAKQFGSTPEEIFVNYEDVKNIVGADAMKSLPLGAVGIYSYVDKLRVGLQKLMARCFSVPAITRRELMSLTEECAKVTGIPYLMDAYREEAEAILGS